MDWQYGVQYKDSIAADRHGVFALDCVGLYSTEAESWIVRSTLVQQHQSLLDNTKSFSVPAFTF